MAADIPNLGAIHSLGGQFNTNAFEHMQKNLHNRATKQAQEHNAQVKTTESNRDRFAASAAQGVQQGRTKFSAQQTARSNAAAKASQTQAKTMQQQRNFAHGQAIQVQNQINRSKQQRVNYAHGQAIQEAKKRGTGSPVSTVTAPKTPSLTPAFSSAPATHTPVKAQKIAPTTFSSQFTPQRAQQGPHGVATASFSHGTSPSAPSTPTAPQTSITGPQFSQHSHPAGSSTAPLPTLTASQPKPNTFTTGSRNAKPGGLAARGSQLEAWAMGKQREVREQRGTNN